jgi:multiple sugar transport system permease protein
MTGGANRTETVSFLAYRQTVTLLNLGMGSAVSVVLFLSAVVLATVCIVLLRPDVSGIRSEG